MNSDGQLEVGMVLVSEYFDPSKDLLVRVVECVMSNREYEYGLFPKGWFEIAKRYSV